MGRRRTCAGRSPGISSSATDRAGATTSHELLMALNAHPRARFVLQLILEPQPLLNQLLAKQQ
jgi:hypothetical protein